MGRKKSQSGKLVLYGPRGKSLERPVDRDLLEDLLLECLRESGAQARISWEKTGSLGTKVLAARWPNWLRPPGSAHLRSGHRFRTGMALQIEVPVEELDEYADDLVRFLSGQRPLPRYEAMPIADQPEGAPPARRRHDTIELDVTIAPRHQPQGPAPPPRVEQFLDAEELQEIEPADVKPAATEPEPAPAASQSAPAESVPLDAEPTDSDDFLDESLFQDPVEDWNGLPEGVEVLPPGRDERKKGTGRRWRQGPDDVFAIFGPVHPEDAMDDGLEIVPEDLAWLNPGDRILSERRGRCRIIRVEDDGQQVVVKDERGRQLVLRSDELLSEFSFDDEPDPRFKKS